MDGVKVEKVSEGVYSVALGHKDVGTFERLENGFYYFCPGKGKFDGTCLADVMLVSIAKALETLNDELTRELDELYGDMGC